MCFFDSLNRNDLGCHRSWGPLEPFYNAFPEALRQNGVYSHLVTDHYHYWEDGGATYHNRYSSYEFICGQECDAWKALMEPEICHIPLFIHDPRISIRARSECKAAIRGRTHDCTRSYLPKR